MTKIGMECFGTYQRLTRVLTCLYPLPPSSKYARAFKLTLSYHYLHEGSITKISTIPNTSFFLTGSKDGDVKLWDAKRAKLVYHWPKLHERHTFLQPSSRGFGGVFRVTPKNSTV